MAALDYVMGAGGVTSQNSYPYDLTKTTCDKSKNQYVVAVTGYNQLHCENDMINHVLTVGTITVVIDMTQAGYYKSGIYANCDPAKVTPNQAVNIVGVNVKEGYWIIQSTWGPWWGENGYMKLALVSKCATILTSSHSSFHPLK